MGVDEGNRLCPDALTRNPRKHPRDGVSGSKNPGVWTRGFRGRRHVGKKVRGKKEHLTEPAAVLEKLVRMTHSSASGEPGRGESRGRGGGRQGGEGWERRREAEKKKGKGRRRRDAGAEVAKAKERRGGRFQATCGSPARGGGRRGAAHWFRPRRTVAPVPSGSLLSDTASVPGTQPHGHCGTQGTL